MTILVPFIDTNNVIGLAADRIYSPFAKPQLMTGSKVFERDDFVWGATGDISIVDYRTQEINNFADFVDNFKATKGDCVIVAVHDNQVYSIDLNMDKPVFHNNTKSDEPLAWGCFKHMFGECFDAFIVNSEDEVVQFIRTLHSMYGYDGESATDHTLVKSGTPRVALNSNTIQKIAPMLASVIKEGSVCTADEWKELTESINKHL